MTDKVNPTLDGGISSQQTAAAIRFAGGSSTGWVVPSTDDPANVATDDADIDETALNAFAESHSSSSFDVTIDPGQGYVGGAWVARDISTTVTLASSTTGQTVYVGWDVTGSDTVIIGLSSDFTASDPKMPIWDFDTDGSGVTSSTDRRNLDSYRIPESVLEAIPVSGLAFDPATQTELNNHAADASAHHIKPGGGTAISFDGTNNEYDLLYGNALTIDANGDLAVSEGAISHDNIAGVSSADHHTRGHVTYSQTSEPTGSDGETWYDPGTGLYHINDSGTWEPVPPAQVLDEATAFDGSDGESVTQTNTRVNNGSVELHYNYTTTASRPADNSTIDGEIGLFINPNTDLAGVRLTLSANTDPSQASSPTARLKDANDNTLVSKDISGLTPGDTVQFEYSLSAATEYIVTVDTGSTSANGFYDSASFPYTSTDIDIVDGYADFSAGRDSGRALAWSDVTAFIEATSGDVLVQWSDPADLDGWDIATFQRTLDGETVTIDVEDDAGNVLFSDIDENFDISTVSTSKDVAIRANLSRSNTANNPTLDYAARRYLR